MQLLLLLIGMEIKCKILRIDSIQEALAVYIINLELKWPFLVVITMIRDVVQF